MSMADSHTAWGPPSDLGKKLLLLGVPFMHSERKSAIQCSHRLCGIDTADTYAMPDLAGLLVSCIPYTCGTANLYIFCVYSHAWPGLATLRTATAYSNSCGRIILESWPKPCCETYAGCSSGHPLRNARHVMPGWLKDVRQFQF